MYPELHIKFSSYRAVNTLLKKKKFFTVV